MAIFQTQTTSFKKELYEGVHNFLVDTINMALYTNSALLDADTTVYTNVGEVVGIGYLAGGKTLTGITVASYPNGTAYVNFASAIWNPANFTCRGALIYNASKGNKSIVVLDFGSEKTAINSFTVKMPDTSPVNALIRSQ